MGPAKMQFKVISSEMIRPSSRTPPHLKYFKLSLLDQYASHAYSQTIFHYPRTNCSRNIGQVLDRLKHSLAETLSLYYPIAGRIKDHLSIDCNDEGALFIHARIDSDMSTFLKRPDLDRLFEFFPSEFNGTVKQPANTLIQVCVQVNVFSCGGISIGLSCLHKVMDGVTIVAFIECWAKVASCSLDKAVKPDLTSASYIFPSTKMTPEASVVGQDWLWKEGRCVLRRFVFDNKSISTLKANAASQLVPNPTRVEGVACFIWKSIVKALKKENGDKSTVLVTAVDIRAKTTPTLRENSFGNILWWTIHNHIADSTNDLGVQGFVRLLREGFIEVDGDHVKRMQGDQGGPFVDKFMEEVGKFQSKVKREPIFFSSTNKFLTFTKLDFGWGNPLWINHVRGARGWTVYRNQIILGNTGWDDAIEAWIYLGEKEMAILENDKTFLTFAASNPSIPQPLGRL